jgi:hypothetical protein
VRGILLCAVLALLIVIGMSLAQGRAFAFESPVSPVTPEPREVQVWAGHSQNEGSHRDDVSYAVEPEQRPDPDVRWANVFGTRVWPVGEHDEAGCQRFSDGSVNCP